MKPVYLKHKDIIESLFINEDIEKILVSPLKNDFDEFALNRIDESKDFTVKIFFEEFQKIALSTKYINFVETSSNVSEWIAALLISMDDGESARRMYNVSKNLINLHIDFFIDHLSFDYSVIEECLKDSLISSYNAELLKQIILVDGVDFAKYKFQTLLHVHSVECYSKFLYLCQKHNSIYLEIFHPDLFNMLQSCTSDEELRDCIKVTSASEIEDFIYDIHSAVTVPAELEFSSLGNEISQISSISTESKNIDKSDSDSEDEIISDDKYFNEIFGECKDKACSQLLNFQPEISTQKATSLEMRQYQDELAKKGIEGKNVLICAPTSSGKTVVAIKITQEHMMSNVSGKVALVVPTTVLVDQQYNLFNKYLGKKLRITKLSGGSKSFALPLSKLIEDFEIFVFTSDILRNSLEDQEEPLKSIGDFSLIIFDECHHCDKDHSYNKVMDHYFKNKAHNLQVPQIIGMTASTGTDKAKNVEAALNSLLSLCANLDCNIVSTVKSNLDEMNKSLPSPSSDIMSPGSRNVDLFETHLLELMDTTENMVSDIFRKNSKPLGIPSDKYHDKYLSFVKSITNYFPNILSEEERKGVKVGEIYLENLYRALIINHLFHGQHSIKMLKEKIDTVAPCTCELEKKLRQLLKDFLSSNSFKQDKNPSLECLKDEIIKQIKEDNKSKIIIFVKEVLYTRILESEIQEARLGFIQCKALVGTNKSSDQGGLSKSETEEIVSRFRKGIINLIFATSVAEEGLDVEKCNLVVRYGHVTNEISMVQTRGRARASNSKYIVIVPHKLKWQINKENINKIRESMMYQAIDKFQNMDLQQVKKELFEFHERRKALRKVGIVTPLKDISERKASTDWLLLCNKCEQYICNSEDIRLANGTSYVNINKDTYPNLIMKKSGQNNPAICSKCQTALGFIIKVEGINVPTIKINQCILRREGENKKCKKWKEAPFIAPPVLISELSDFQANIFAES